MCLKMVASPLPPRLAVASIPKTPLAYLRISQGILDILNNQILITYQSVTNRPSHALVARASLLTPTLLKCISVSELKVSPLRPSRKSRLSNDVTEWRPPKQIKRPYPTDSHWSGPSSPKDSWSTRQFLTFSPTSVAVAIISSVCGLPIAATQSYPLAKPLSIAPIIHDKCDGEWWHGVSIVSSRAPAEHAPRGRSEVDRRRRVCLGVFGRHLVPPVAGGYPLAEWKGEV